MGFLKVLSRLTRFLPGKEVGRAMLPCVGRFLLGGGVSRCLVCRTIESRTATQRHHSDHR